MSKATLLGRDAILRTDVLRRRRLHVADLGGDILVREMTGLESAHFQKRSTDLINPQSGTIRSAEKLARLNASVVICGVINEDGSQVFTNNDADAIMGLPASLLEEIANAVLDLSGLSQRGRAALEKNSARSQIDDSGSD